MFDNNDSYFEKIEKDLINYKIYWIYDGKYLIRDKQKEQSNDDFDYLNDHYDAC